MNEALAKDRSLLFTAIAVMAIHAALLLWSVYEAPTKKIVFQPKRQLVVKTVSLNPQLISETKTAPQKTASKPTPKSIPEPAAPLKPQDSKKPIAEPKPLPKTEPKKPAKKEIKAEPKSNVKKSEKQSVAKSKEESISQGDPIAASVKKKKEELLTKAKDTLAKFSNQKPAGQIALKEEKLPAAIAFLNSDSIKFDDSAAMSVKEIAYRDQLAGMLRLMLRLPEYGTIKIKLTLTRHGSVATLVIISAESTANKKYIENTLPTLTFPAFEDNFKQLSQHTFLISLNNDV